MSNKNCLVNILELLIMFYLIPRPLMDIKLEGRHFMHPNLN